MQYIYGTRRNKDGEDAAARQVQFVVLFHF